jgi:hypothetical protein
LGVEDRFAAVDFEAVVFFAAVDFAAVVFFAVVDFAAVVFFAAVVREVVVFRVVVRFFAGPFARFSASSSNARVAVMPSTESSLRRVAFVVPSVT